MDIKKIQFGEILSVWKTELWPNRVSEIEEISWISHTGQVDMSLKLGTPIFLGAFDSNENLCGVTSGFSINNKYFRIRGTWVDFPHRNQGIANELLSYLIKEAKAQGCESIWTMARSSAVLFYEKLGFQKVLFTSVFEYGPHYIVEKSI